MELRASIENKTTLYPPAHGQGGETQSDTPLTCATSVSRTGAWGSPMADPDVDSSCVAPSAPCGAQLAFKGRCTPQKHPIEP